jgi:hypothetical protein
MSEVKDVLLEEFRVVVEGEYNAKESVRTFAYNVLPKLLPTMPDDFVGFLLNVLNAGYVPLDWTYDFSWNNHFLWLSKGNYDMRIEWTDYNWLKEHPDVNPNPRKPLVRLSPRKCPHITVQAYYTDANISEMEMDLEEKLKDPQNAQCLDKSEEEERRRREEREHAREESERFWKTVEEARDWEVFHIPF